MFFQNCDHFKTHFKTLKNCSTIAELIRSAFITKKHKTIFFYRRDNCMLQILTNTQIEVFLICKHAVVRKNES